MERDCSETIPIEGDECTIILRRIGDKINLGLSLQSNGDAELTLCLALASDVIIALEHFSTLRTVGSTPQLSQTDDCDPPAYGELSFGTETNAGRWSLKLKRTEGRFLFTLMESESGDVRTIVVDFNKEQWQRVVLAAKKLLQ